MSKVFQNDWAQQRAIAALKKMRGDGQSPASIGELLGFSGEMIRRVLKPDEPARVTERMFEVLVEKGLRW